MPVARTSSRNQSIVRVEDLVDAGDHVFEVEAGHVVLRTAKGAGDVAAERPEFAAGERIHTEFAHKYTLDSFAQLARGAGLAVERVWTDDAGLFSVQCLVPR